MKKISNLFLLFLMALSLEASGSSTNQDGGFNYPSGFMRAYFQDYGSGATIEYKGSYDNYIKSVDQAMEYVDKDQNSAIDDYRAIPTPPSQIKEKMKAGDMDGYYTWVNAHLKNAPVVNNCELWQELIQKKHYEVVYSSGAAVGTIASEASIYTDFTTGCQVLSLLKKLKPAKMSYVRNFSLDSKSLNQLPALLLDPVDRNNSDQKGKSIAEYLPLFNKEFGNDGIHLNLTVDAGPSLTVTSKDSKLPKDSAIELSIYLVASGDFLGNGQEQLLVGSTESTDDRINGYTYYLLSRNQTDGLLTIINI